ncbi:unnamed protein product [Schistocephalus solidus]|uniref:Uncharacterized protein n=1 Tax=Schistocephalus solidus TaxID=70667 RepID=A0A183T4X5_SCHSO|nr:unnamed protein product [Schistocephalus solidus]
MRSDEWPAPQWWPRRPAKVTRDRLSPPMLTRARLASRRKHGSCALLAERQDRTLARVHARQSGPSQRAHARTFMHFCLRVCVVVSAADWLKRTKLIGEWLLRCRGLTALRAPDPYADQSRSPPNPNSLRRLG